MPFTETPNGSVQLCPHCGQQLQVRPPLLHVVRAMAVILAAFTVILELKISLLDPAAFIITFEVLAAAILGGVVLINATVMRKWQRFKRAEGGNAG